MLGISIAMDDFGTGYSGLSHLWHYSFDKMKIDRSFVQKFEENSGQHREVLETMIVLGQNMGMAVTIEGIETHQLAEMLDDLRCDQYQGYFFSRPINAEENARFD